MVNGKVTYVVDEIEDIWVCLQDENEKMSLCRRSQFPDELKEGDVVQHNGERFIVLSEETEKRRAEMRKRFDRLKNA